MPENYIYCACCPNRKGVFGKQFEDFKKYAKMSPENGASSPAENQADDLPPVIEVIGSQWNWTAYSFYLKSCEKL